MSKERTILKDLLNSVLLMAGGKGLVHNLFFPTTKNIHQAGSILITRRLTQD
jgi:hypothetical protein